LKKPSSEVGPATADLELETSEGRKELERWTSELMLFEDQDDSEFEELPNDAESYLNPDPLLQSWMDDHNYETHVWERKMNDLQFAQLISRELAKENLPYYYNEYALKIEKYSKSHKATKKGVLDFADYVIGKPTIPDRPAVAAPTAPRIRETKAPLLKVSETHPLAFEYSDYPHSREIYNPFHSRKVTLYVNITALKLPESVRKRLIELCKKRDYYNLQRNQLVIKSQVKKDLRGNKQKVVQIFRELINEAWKADLNYIVPNNNLLPHQIVDKEITDQKQKELEEIQNSFETIKQKSMSWTLFRYENIPAYQEIVDNQQISKTNSEKFINTLNKLH